MIYERIKAEADQKGLTISELEKQSGLGNGVIGGWRTASPNARKLEAVADTLGVSVDYLLKGKKEH
ncbi:MAG: helix-turn-helix domain-containing protein [Clostridia bacterium]|nr:helix-turn-helix domain-containing protein [Clostridia bacterium]